MKRQRKGRATGTFRSLLRTLVGRPDGVGELARFASAEGNCWSGTNANTLARHLRAKHDPTRGDFAALAEAERLYAASKMSAAAR